MKYLKTYNEGLTDKMVAKSDDEIIKSLDKLSDSDKIIKIIEYKLSYDLLPDKLIITGNLLCENKQLTKLPDNLTVNGYLNCSFNQLTELPNNLIVNGDLFCMHIRLVN